jgi:hypothetical protein
MKTYAVELSNTALPAAAWYILFSVVRFRARCAKANNNRKKSTALPQALIASDARPHKSSHNERATGR